MRISVVLLIACVFGVTTGANTAEGRQGCGNFVLCWDGVGDHRLPGPVGSYEGRHGECATCVGGEWCHGPCDALNVDSSASDYHQRLAEAVRLFDLDVIASFMVTLPARVSYHGGRNALQVHGCDGTLIANLPLRDRPLQILAFRDPQLVSSPLDSP
jgi:hypothetical protein